MVRSLIILVLLVGCSHQSKPLKFARGEKVFYKVSRQPVLILEAHSVITENYYTITYTNSFNEICHTSVPEHTLER